MRVAFCAIVYDPSDHRKTRAMLESAVAAGFTDFVIGIDEKSMADTGAWIAAELTRGVREATLTRDVFTFKMERADGEVDFAAARNLTLPRIPKECEWWGWADSDDVIEKRGPATIADWLATVRHDVQTVYFEYDYLKDEFGNRVSDHLKGRLYRTGIGWEWKRRIHEDCFPAKGAYGVRPGDVHFQIVRIDDEDEPFRWVQDTTDRHQGNATKRNLGALKAMLEENPGDAATWHGLANQHYADGRYQVAAEAYHRGAELDDWVHRKWTNLIYESICYRNLSDFDKAIETDTSAVHLCPELADGYFGLAHSYVQIGDWERAKRFGEIGMSRLVAGDGMPNTTVLLNLNHYFFAPYHTLGAAYYNLGEWPKALSAYEQAYKTRPEPGLAQLIDALKWQMDRRRIIHNGIDLAAGLLRRNEPLKGLNVLTNLPAGSSDDPNVQAMLHAIGGKVAHLGDRAAYQNLYFNEEEQNDPLEIAFDDVAMERELPRMAWALRRLQAAGVKKILDFGIGDGTFDFYVARYGIQVVGIDVDRRRVKHANWSAVAAGFLGTTKIAVPVDPWFEGCTCAHDNSEHGWKDCKRIECSQCGKVDVDCKCEAPTPVACECQGHWSDEAEDQAIESPDQQPDSPVQFLYCAPGEITPQVEALGPFDAVVAAELIEHLDDSESLLALCERMAPRVLLTTPDGAYDGPQLINRGHVRAWSQREFTRLVAGRGRIVEMHRTEHAPGQQANLVCEYVTGEELPASPVIIWCPNTGQDWNPDSLRTGIGGSETAVIRVAEELAARGKRVTVFAECEGVWNGVRYAFSENFVPQPCELFVSWRTYGPTGMMKDFAPHRWVWCHDVVAGPMNEEQLKGVKLVALSQWHAGFLTEQYPTAEVVRSGNGIEPEAFTGKGARVQHRLIYAQSPDRGLDVVLKAFPRIRAKYGDAELHVFYGFEMARRRLPTFIAQIEDLARQPGVSLHGRIGQKALADEYLKADAVLYPARTPDGQSFDETYCISVVEAQAAGCIPITADHGALRETNDQGIRVPVATFEQDALRVLFDLWDRPKDHRRKMREHARAWARQQTWGQVADGWVAALRPKLTLVEATEAAAE